MNILIWSKSGCIYCEKAKEIMLEEGLEYEERIIGDGWSKNDLLEMIPDAKKVPQIFIDNTHIGGYTDLVEFLNSD